MGNKELLFKLQLSETETINQTFLLLKNNMSVLLQLELPNLRKWEKFNFSNCTLASSG